MLIILLLIFVFKETLEDPTLTEDEYRASLGKDYIFFEITDPEELAYTYKVSSTTDISWI